MGTAEERMRILKMLEEGTITAEDATRLLQAVSAGRAANGGRTPTGREARWLRGRLDEAMTGLLTAAPDARWDPWSEGAADGAYAYDLGGGGVEFKDLALALGACASPWRNPAGAPLLDCGVLTE